MSTTSMRGSVSAGAWQKHSILLFIPLLVFGACSGGGSGDASSNPPSSSHTVSTSVLGPGSISPASATVASGGSTLFTITPDSGYQIAWVEGCSGSLSGTTYTTGAIASDCTVAAAFTAATSGGNWDGVVQSSDKAVLWGFDFVEEFDGLQDWNQSHLGRIGNQFDDTDLDRMPKLADGSPSPWGYFSSWDIDVSTHAWIGDTTGGRQVWRGTKSAAIDLGETGHGPSRLGLFFGGEGYKDFSLFYMVWIPANMFPTGCTNPGDSCAGENLGEVGQYVEGDPYVYWAAWKFNTFDMECNAARCPPPRGPQYGVHSTVPLIKQYNYTPNGLLILNANYPDPNIYALDAGTTLNAFMDQWWGVEFRIRNNATDTEYTLDIWTYDQAGNSSHVLQGHTFPIVAEAHGGSWDRFFFGGNNSNSWVWGPTMQSHYYVDDLIIDAGSKGRIGPRYFDAIR